MNASQEKIRSLMEAFSTMESTLRQLGDDKNEADWQPALGKEMEAFNDLVAVENRQALKEWFSAVSSLNPLAERFRRILERATGDSLPVGQATKPPVSRR